MYCPILIKNIEGKRKVILQDLTPLDPLTKSDKRQTVLESAVFHFVQQDLLHHLVDVFGFKGLTDEEREMISVFSGASKHARSKGC